MNRLSLILGFMSASICSFGMLFKMMHWPGASVLVFTGILLLNFGFLPVYYYRRFKQD